MVVACVALGVALGGTSVAAVTQVVPRSSVGTVQLKNNAVSTAKLRNQAVTGAKIRSNTITSSDVRNGSLIRADFAPGELAENVPASRASLASAACSASSARPP